METSNWPFSPADAPLLYSTFLPQPACLVTRLDAAKVPAGKLTVFSAASADQITGALEEQGHGIFTYFFLKGLNAEAKGRQAALGARAVHGYLVPKVQDAARRQNREQIPLLLGDPESAIGR